MKRIVYILYIVVMAMIVSCSGCGNTKDGTAGNAGNADFERTMRVADSLYSSMQFRDAYDLYLQLLDSEELEADSEKRLRVLNSLSNASGLSGHKDMENKWLQQQLDLAEATGNDYYHAMARVSMGQNIFFDMLHDAGIVNYKPEFLTACMENLAQLGQWLGYFDKTMERDLYMDYISPKNADHRKQRGRTAPNRALSIENIQRLMKYTDTIGMSTSICFWVRNQLKVPTSIIPIINRNGFQCLGYQSKLFKAEK